jgi:DNA polymerase-3 subunit beta
MKKFGVNSKSLLQSLLMISSAVPVRSSLAILDGNILLKLKEDKLSLCVNNLEIYIEHWIDVEYSGDEYSIVAPFGILVKTLKELPNESLSFDIEDETHKINIKIIFIIFWRIFRN